LAENWLFIGSPFDCLHPTFQSLDALLNADVFEMWDLEIIHLDVLSPNALLDSRTLRFARATQSKVQER
jgi:hypothetical protein